LRQWHWHPFAGGDGVEQFHCFRKHDAVALDQTDGASTVTLECRDDIARSRIASPNVTVMVQH
jgi:hypothetical protein